MKLLQPKVHLSVAVILLTLLFSFLGGKAWGQTTVSFVSTVDKGQTETSVSKDGVTIKTSDGKFKSYDEYRTYSSSILTISSEVGNIQKVEFTAADKYKVSDLGSASVGTYSNGTWTGDAASFTLKASSQVRLSQIVVTLTISGCAAPTFTPEPGEFSTADYKVTLATTTEDASIYYTTDGVTEPSETSTLYTEDGITLNATTTIKAIAIKEGLDNSEVVTATYTKVKPTPTLAFGATEYNVNFGQQLSIAATTNSTGKVTYSLTDEAGTGSTIDATTGMLTAGNVAGDVTVTATLEETTEYQGATISTTVGIKDPNKKEYEDVILPADVPNSGTSYQSFTDLTKSSGVLYAGQTSRFLGGIGLRTKNEDCGIVSTANPNGLRLKAITIAWMDDNTNGRAVNIYGKSDAYTDASDLFKASTKGTLLGTLALNGETTLTVDGDYTFVGITSSDGALSLSSIKLVWEGSATQVVIDNPTVSLAAGTFDAAQSVTMTAAEGNVLVYTTDDSDPTTSPTATTTTSNTETITLSKTTTLKVAATDGAGHFSGVLSNSYKFVTLSGNGTYDDAYLVSDVKLLVEMNKEIDDDIWVMGYITGAIASGPKLDNTDATNIALADDETETAVDNMIAVGLPLPTNTETIQLRAIANVVDNASNIGQLVFVKGRFDSGYFKLGGLTSVSQIEGLRSLDITTDEGYGTYYNDCAYIMPEGVSGTIITAAEGTKLSVDEKYVAGDLVPSKTALLVKGAKKSYGIINTNSGAAAPAPNLLHGADAVNAEGLTEVAPTNGGTMKYYILSHNQQGRNLGFYWAAADGAAISYQAPYAFLAIESTAAQAAPMGFSLTDDVTGIDGIQTETIQANEKIYNISGQQMNATKLPKGVYIVGGKKVLVK